MNTTITKLVGKTENNNVLTLASKLIAWGNRKVRVCFTKKDGTVRNLVCVPNNAWNAMNGIDGFTKSGLKMLNTKLNRGIVTVSEVLANGTFQPRSIDLNRVISLELA